MSQMDHYLGDLPSLLTPAGRAHGRALASVRRATSVALARTDGLAAISEQIMTDVTALDRHRRLLARGDETLDALLREVEIGHVMAALNEQRTAFRRY